MAKKLELKTKPNKIGKTIQDTLLKGKLCLFMERGLTVDDAAKLVGVTKYKLSTLRSDPEFEDFIEACTLKCESDNLGNIKEAGDMGQWQASSWILERLYPDKYGKKDTIRHEYELKLNSFMQLVFGVINSLDPLVRSSVYAKLKDIDVDMEVINMKQAKELTYEVEKTA
ncbi:unnamed protein product [marine sediment metagenome]|uniref:Uncharacterized protein n=1 Tax=marine sediment metagenome TaxID=412755 RepID=X0SPE2_9ZZZZ